MLLEKNYIINESEEELWNFASDIKTLSECIPGLESFEQIGSKRFTAKVKPRFSFLGGSLKLNFEIIALKKGKGKIKITGAVIGGSFDVMVAVSSRKKGKNTELNLKIEAEFGGLLRPIPQSMMKGSAQQLADEMFECMKEKIKKR